MPEVIRVTDDTSRPALQALLTRLVHGAKRETPVVGSTAHPSPWDNAHACIDAVLDDWRTAAP